jgi:Flp pilus assembly protein TadG
MVKQMVTLLRKLGNHADSGNAAVEFAISAPFFVLLCIGVVDYGAFVGTSSGLESATRAGAEVVLAGSTATATQLATLGVLPSGSTFTRVCSCIDNSWPIGGACPPAVNTTPCAGKTNPYTSAADQRVLQYTSVTATQSFSPIAAYTGLGFPGSLSTSTMVRTQ